MMEILKAPQNTSQKLGLATVIILGQTVILTALLWGYSTLASRNPWEVAYNCLPAIVISFITAVASTLRPTKKAGKSASIPKAPYRDTQD